MAEKRVTLLAFGSKGPEVENFQKLLNEYFRSNPNQKFIPLETDADFGRLTLDALVLAQKQLKCTIGIGVAGPVMLRLLRQNIKPAQKQVPAPVAKPSNYFITSKAPEKYDPGYLQSGIKELDKGIIGWLKSLSDSEKMDAAEDMARIKPANEPQRLLLRSAMVVVAGAYVASKMNEYSQKGYVQADAIADEKTYKNGINDGIYRAYDAKNFNCYTFFRDMYASLFKNMGGAKFATITVDMNDTVRGDLVQIQRVPKGYNSAAPGNEHANLPYHVFAVLSKEKGRIERGEYGLKGLREGYSNSLQYKNVYTPNTGEKVLVYRLVA